MNPRSSPEGVTDFSMVFGAPRLRKHRMVNQNRLLSISGRLGATRPSRMASKSSTNAARASTVTTNVLQSGIRGCLRAAMALESAQDHLGTTSACKSSAQACSGAAKARKSMAQACSTPKKLIDPAAWPLSDRKCCSNSVFVLLRSFCFGVHRAS